MPAPPRQKPRQGKTPQPVLAEFGLSRLVGVRSPGACRQQSANATYSLSASPFRVKQYCPFILSELADPRVLGKDLARVAFQMLDPVFRWLLVVVVVADLVGYSVR